MRLPITVVFSLLSCSAIAQPEFSTGVAINKNDASGIVLHAAHDFRLTDKFYTKTQIGHKRLQRYNDYVGATLKVRTWEIHQTVSYRIVNNKKYILQPNLGLNYRFYTWKGEMDPPYDVTPQRAWVIGVRDGNFVLNSFDNQHSKTYRVNNLGFSIQLQNQFSLNNKLWFHITPFMEPDYDRSQNTGGGYFGFILKEL